MAKRSKIRRTETDSELVARTVRNFNRKIDRVAKRNPELAKYQPQKITTEDVWRKVQTRSDLKREVSSLQRYSKRGSEDVITSSPQSGAAVTVTKWEKNEIGIKVGTINRERTKRRKELKDIVPTTRGQPTELSLEAMGSPEVNALKPKKYNFEGMNKSNWKKFVEGVDKMSNPRYNEDSLRKMRSNYVSKVFETFYGYPELLELMGEVMKLDPELFYKMYLSDIELSFDIFYDSNSIEAKANILIDAWTAAFVKAGEL